MTELVVALSMIINGEIKEARIQKSMTECLKGKRVAKREYKSPIKKQERQSRAKLEQTIDRPLAIKKLIRE